MKNHDINMKDYQIFLALILAFITVSIVDTERGIDCENVAEYSNCMEQEK